jgi:hypothetical protein
MKFIIGESQILRSKKKFLDNTFKDALLLNSKQFSNPTIVFVTPNYEFLGQYMKNLSFFFYNQDISKIYMSIFYPTSEEEFIEDLRDWLSISYEIKPRMIYGADGKNWENLKKL